MPNFLFYLNNGIGIRTDTSSDSIYLYKPLWYECARNYNADPPADGNYFYFGRMDTGSTTAKTTYAEFFGFTI